MDLLDKFTASGASLMAIDRGVLQLTDTSVIFEMASQSGVATAVITGFGALSGVTYFASQMGFIEGLKDTVENLRN